MEIERLTIPDVIIIKIIKHEDDRGFFSETYNQKALSEVGVNINFNQDNHAFSFFKGTVRGLHFQIPPFQQDKLVRVVAGAIFDVAVDLRVGSPTYGQHVSAVIDTYKWNQILVPAGFAHGLCTLEPNTEVIYKVNNHYSPDHDRGIIRDDTSIGIRWPVSKEEAILSTKDLNLPKFSDLPSYFKYIE